MQVTLFKALKSVNVADDEATAVVASLEEHVDTMIGDSTRGLETQIKGVSTGLEMQIRGLSTEVGAFKSVLSTQIDGVRESLQDVKASQSRQTTFLGAMIAIVGLAIAAGPIVAKFIH